MSSSARPQEEDITTTIKAFIKRHPLPTYFALTFAISWGAILVVVGPGGLPLSSEPVETLGLAMLLGPGTTSILLIGLTHGRAGLHELLSRLLRWRVGARWYAVALLTAPLSTVTVLLGLSLLSPEFLPIIFTSDDKAALVVTGISAGLVVGLFEELGWTGFAVPQLRRHFGVPAAGLIVGLLWGAWHFILFWEDGSFSGALPVALLLGRLFSWLPAYRVLMVWVYDRSGSLLVAILMHVSLVATMVIFEPPLTGGGPLTYVLVRGAVLWAVAAAVALARRRADQEGWSRSNSPESRPSIGLQPTRSACGRSRLSGRRDESCRVAARRYLDGLVEFSLYGIIATRRDPPRRISSGTPRLRHERSGRPGGCSWQGRACRSLVPDPQCWRRQHR